MKAEEISVLYAWELCFDNAPKRTGLHHSPFREDRSPSMSIFSGGRKWLDHGSGKGGDAYDFVKEATGLATFAEQSDFLNKRSPAKVKVARAPLSARSDKIVGFSPATLRRVKLSAMVQLSRYTSDHSLAKLFAKKHIDGGIKIMGYLPSPSIGIMGPWIAWIYDHGVKLRTEVESSKSCRWIIGSAGGKPWLHSRLLDPAVSRVLIFEGETDLLYATHWIINSIGRVPDDVALVAAPAASWRPTADYIKDHLAGRKVITVFDYDEAGRAATSWFVRNTSSKFLDWRKTSAVEGDDFSKLGSNDIAPFILSAFKS